MSGVKQEGEGISKEDEEEVIEKQIFFDHLLNFRLLMFKIPEITLKSRHYCPHFTVHRS